MESVLALIGLLIGLALFFAPIVSLVGFLRTRRLQETVATLEETVRGLERRLEVLARAQARAQAQPATDPPTQPRVVPAAAAAPPAAPVAPPAPPVTPTLAGPEPPPVPPAPAGPEPAREPAAAPAPLAAPAPPPLPAAASRRPHATWPPPPPEAAGPGIPRAAHAPAGGPPPPEVPEAAAAFDWESMLGVRGAAWLAGITFVIAALFFAKWSIDQGFFTPLIRVILLVAAGTGALVWAEVGLRRGYQPAADAISGAGVVVLYAAWFTAHRYQLIGVTPAFAMMSAVTAIAALIAIRHGAMFTAILGLIGGLATPLLLSTGQDRPIALFSYLAILNVGFLFVARRQGWAVITAIALAGTTLLQLGWLMLRLTVRTGPGGLPQPDTVPITIVAFAVIGGLYLWHAIATQEDGDEVSTSHALGFIGAVLPLLVAVVLAGDGRFVAQWPLVLGNVAALDAVAIAVGLWRLRPLVAVSAVTTLCATAIWALHASQVPSVVAPALVVLALTAIYNVVGRLDPAARPAAASGPRPAMTMTGASGLTVAVGLYLFTLAVLAQVVPPAPLMVAIAALLFLVVVERTSVDVAPLVLPAGAFLIGLLGLVWFETAAVEGRYVGLLAFPHVVAVAFAILGTVRRRLGLEDDDAAWLRADCAMLVAVAVANLGLHIAVDRLAFSAPRPIFALLGLDVALVLLAAIRQGWTWLVPMAAVTAWAGSAAWHVQWFRPGIATIAVAAEIALYLTFVVLPFVLSAVRPATWRRAAASWLTSALIGPAFFFIFRPVWVELIGTNTIGLLAVALAAVSVASLAGVGRVFAAAPGDAEAAARRLNYLALFSAIALGFVATAIAIQLDRQWITIGWALEAAAVFWVFGLVPHPGLKYFGLLLFGAVGVRLLFNPEVLRYEPRGAPIVNWLLYTYGVPVLCTFAGAWFLRRAEARREDPPEYDWTVGDRTLLVPAIGGLGVVLLFWLINLEIADFFSAGRYVEIDFSRRLERDLTRSIAWGIYSLALLGVGLWRGHKGLRIASLVFLLLTVGKVFLYDLSALTGIYRILSFLGLGIALIIVSLLYQRFVAKART